VESFKQRRYPNFSRIRQWPPTNFSGLHLVEAMMWAVDLLVKSTPHEGMLGVKNIKPFCALKQLA